MKKLLSVMLVLMVLVSCSTNLNVFAIGEPQNTTLDLVEQENLEQENKA